MINKIYAANNISMYEIGTKYTMQEVLLILTENYFIAQGFMSKSCQQIFKGNDDDLEALAPST